MKILLWLTHTGSKQSTFLITFSTSGCVQYSFKISSP